MNDPGRFHRAVLPSGLTLIGEEMDSVRSLAIGVWLKVGARHESPAEGGMSHFLEHMVFKGTAKRKDIPTELSSHGARPNGTTSWDRTNYFETFGVRTEVNVFRGEHEATVTGPSQHEVVTLL